MPEEVHYLPEKGMIKVRSYGEISMDDWQGSLRRVIEISDRESVDLVLVDTREQKATPGSQDIYDFSVSLPKHLKFAVILPDAFQCSDLDEIENTFKVLEAQVSVSKICDNKGKQVRLFNNYDKAVNWLKEEELEPSDY